MKKNEILWRIAWRLTLTTFIFVVFWKFPNLFQIFIPEGVGLASAFIWLFACWAGTVLVYYLFGINLLFDKYIEKKHRLNKKVRT